MKQNPILQLHEWLAVAVFISLLVILSLINLSHNRSLPPDIALSNNLEAHTIEATIEGAVKNPGTYEFPKGATIQDLIEKGEPLADANLKKIKMGSKLKNGRVLHVPQIKKITVYLEGAVEIQGALEVHKGATLQDLKDLAQLTPDADLSKFNKRKLKDQEVVVIPRQQQSP